MAGLVFSIPFLTPRYATRVIRGVSPEEGRIAKSGIEVCRFIVKTIRRCHPKIVALSQTLAQGRRNLAQDAMNKITLRQRVAFGNENGGPDLLSLALSLKSTSELDSVPSRC